MGFWVGFSVSGAIVSGSVVGGDGGFGPTRSTCSENIINMIGVAMVFCIIKQIDFMLVLVASSAYILARAGVCAGAGAGAGAGARARARARARAIVLLLVLVLVLVLMLVLVLVFVL